MIARHEAEVKRLSQEGVSKREIAKRTRISRASVRHLLGDGNPWRAICSVPGHDPDYASTFATVPVGDVLVAMTHELTFPGGMLYDRLVQPRMVPL